MNQQIKPHPLDLAETYLSEVRDVAPSPKVNKQLFSERPSGDGSYYAQPDRLSNDKPPNLTILHERPEHRIMVYLKAQGLSNKEIADRCGYGYQWVCQIVRQPWFRQAFLEETKSAGRDAVETFLKGETMNSIVTLVEIRDDTEAKEATRVAAANAILDRALGRPTQHIKTEHMPSNTDAQQEMEKLEQELSELKKRQVAEGLQGSLN